jgi:hypothetical protein
MRPTIPLAEWRLAVAVSSTRDLQVLPGRPASDCACAWCRNWAEVYRRALPTSLQEEFHRLGIDPAHPSDLYAFAETREFVDYRVTYHCVGEILGGPAVYREDPKLGQVREYVSVRNLPPLLGLSVAYQDAVHEPAPWYFASSEGKLIQVDVRLGVPWLLQEPRPPVSVA